MPADPTTRRAGPKKVSFIGTYVPRRCGIATFSNDLLTALRAEARSTEWWAVALNDGADDYDYPPEVHFEIEQKSLADYRKAVDFLNMNRVDAVCLQHEFGIYGGASGSYVLRPLEYLRMPVVSTLHTVLKEPSREQHDIISAIGQFSDRVVVMSEMARDVLTSVYRLDKNRVTVIPHGVPDMPFLDTSYNKDQFGLVGKKLILTFGLLSEGKGLEYVIDGLPEIVRAHPDAIFAILGATHPEVRRREGEAYRHLLQRRARDLGVADNVVFYNQFIDNATLSAFLSAADVVVTPYLGREQIVSGVLSYALGAGKAIVSTPYWYAEEMLADEHGVLVPFRDAGATAAAIVRLLSDDVERNAMRKRAYLKARPMVWSEVANQYLRVFREVRRDRTLRPRSYRIKTLQSTTLELPYPRLDHLKVLTDGTGILQHARFDIPDRDHGYCTDDNARALIVALQAQHVLAEKDNDTSGLSHTYLSFLQHAFNPDNGRFRNFMGYDRQWREDEGSEDSHGRALWALGQTVLDSPLHGMASAAMALFNQALPRAVELKPVRAVAYALLGIEAYLRRFSGATEVRRAQAQLAERLFAAFSRHASPDWPWPEDQLTYANGLLPHALIASGARLENDAMVQMGVNALEWLNAIQIDAKGHFVPIGNRGWYNRNGTRARFDQQPIEVQHMADASLEALRVTSEAHWLEDARRCFEWFLGRNDLGQPVCDHATGGCRDGLQPEGLNHNQGAESTLAWLHTLIALHVATGATSTTVSEITTARRPPAASPPHVRVAGERSASANAH
ncbi:MAG TPA: glycosyltransferase family 4 protein [Bauldia sp.]|nr:glycosyltransferase family 4 protein [Bauldia sp.]